MDVSKILLVFGLLLFGGVSFIMYMKATSTFAKIATSILMAFFLAILAYNFVPENNYDLVRHWEVSNKFENVESLDGFMRVIGVVDLEVIPKFYSFIIAKIGDQNLMQSFVVLLGYAALFYILIDYKNRKKMLNYKFLLLLPLIVFGQHVLFYFSGLYNYLAINIFALALYLDFIKEKNKFSMLLYLTTPFIHMSMLLPLILLILFKLMGKKLTKKSLIIFIMILISFTALINLLTEIFDWEYLHHAKNAYYNYILHNDKMIKFYDGFYMFMTVVKTALSLLACWILKNQKENKHTRDFVILLSVAMIILAFSSIAMTRFSSLVLFAAIPLLFDLVDNNTKLARRMLFIIGSFGLVFMAYSIYTMAPLIKIGGF
jgi:hypothetical protein